jgi:hypothetical protein
MRQGPASEEVVTIATVPTVVKIVTPITFFAVVMRWSIETPTISFHYHVAYGTRNENSDI